MGRKDESPIPIASNNAGNHVERTLDWCQHERVNKSDYMRACKFTVAEDIRVMQCIHCRKFVDERITPLEVVDAIAPAYAGRDGALSPEEVEVLMRPFFRISHDTGKAIIDLLRKRNIRTYDVDHWMEANYVVSGDIGPEREARIQFLMMDTCTCVLAHLPKALEFAVDGVDARILALAKKSFPTNEIITRHPLPSHTSHTTVSG
jgi:hypothetical protein